MRIAADAALGMRQRELAQRYSISEKTVGRAIARSRKSAAGPSLERLAERWHQIDEAVDELAQVRMSATPSAAVAAIRVQADLLRERNGILQELGLAPQSPNIALIETFCERLVAAAEVGLDPEGRAWLRETIDQLLHDSRFHVNRTPLSVNMS